MLKGKLNQREQRALAKRLYEIVQDVVVVTLREDLSQVTGLTLEAKRTEDGLRFDQVSVFTAGGFAFAYYSKRHKRVVTHGRAS